MAVAGARTDDNCVRAHCRVSARAGFAASDMMGDEVVVLDS